MPPLSTDEYDTAVNLVLGGMAPVQAWESASRPGKNRQAGLSNIRARVKRARRDAPALCDPLLHATTTLVPAPTLRHTLAMQMWLPLLWLPRRSSHLREH